MFSWYEDEVRAIEDELQRMPDADKHNKIVLYGSSSMRQWQSFQEHFPEFAFVNVAFGGSTLEACVYFFERLVVACQPREIFFYAGDNDIGDGHSAEKVMASLDALLARLDAHLLGDIPFVFISIKPSIARWPLRERIRKVNDYAEQRMGERPNWQYLNIWDPMLNAHGHPGRHYYCEDGLHMTEHGYRVWADVLRKSR